MKQTHKLHTPSSLILSRGGWLRTSLILLAFTVLAVAALSNWSKTRVSAAGPANLIIALTNGNQLLRFNAATPGTLIGAPVAVSGLVAGDTLVGIDFRPATGQLYALGVNGAIARLYTLNPATGTATQVGLNIALPQSAGVAAGTDYGFDFNPTVDRIRVVANSRDNFRLNPDVGAVAGADTALTAGAQITGAAYDRNFGGATQTTLFGIDFNTDQLVTIGGVNGAPSPNGGAVTTVGNLGVNTSNLVGFDVAGDVPGSAHASLTVGGTPGFYTINLGTGAATLVGTIGNGATPITDMAVAPGGVLRFTAPTYTVAETGATVSITVNRTGGAFGAAAVTVSTANGTATAGADYTATTVTLNFADGVTSQSFNIPVLNDALVEGNETVILNFSNYTGCGLTGPSGLLTVTDDEDGLCNLWAVDSNNNLLRFTADAPGTLISLAPITGLQAGERITGIDFRPATGQLFAMGVAGATGRLYTLNLGTAAATLIGGGFALPQSAGVGAGTDYGFDFNPTVDRIRVVADSRDNFRLNPDTGGIAGADTALTAGAVVTGAAYDRNYVASPQPTTTLYAIDANTDQLVTIGGINGTPSPNTGAVTNIGSLGFNTTTVLGFDIINGAENTAFALLNLVGGQSGLYTLNLATGAATPVGLVNSGFPIVAFAAATAGTVQFSAGSQIVSEAVGTATITVTRTGGACGSIIVTASTSDGTAIAPGDYTATTVTLNFPEGVTSRTFAVPIVNDNIDEGAETVNLTLSANVGGRITAPVTQTLTIADDDTAAVSINDINVAEGFDGLSNAVFTISLSNPSATTVNVNFATANGTATAGSDYNAANGLVTFTPGVTSQTIAVQVIGDTLFEPDETFFVNLSNNPAILDGQGQATIVNDDISTDPVGIPLRPENSFVNDQKAGSLLIFPVYTSSASAGNTQNTRVSITNIDNRRNVAVHLFFVDGTSCSVSDSYVCLTANQTTTFLASDVDPGTTGYLVAVAVNSTGCPIIFNGLIGDAYVKFPTGHAANLGAEAVAGLSGLATLGCSPGTTSTQLNFDGAMYNWLPRTLAADNLPDRAAGNDTLLIIDRIGGNLATSGATLGALFGIIYDDAEIGVSFSFGLATCQLRNSLSNSTIRTTPRYEQLIPAGRSGWLRLWSFNDAAIVGATINFNPNAGVAANAFNQGHNLHILTVTTTATVTIPIFPPVC